MYSGFNPVISILTIYPKELIIHFRERYMYEDVNCCITDNI